MEGLVEKTVRAYDLTARDYAERVKDIYVRDEFDLFLIGLPPRSLILDIGCGSGRDAQVFGKEGYRVIGIDLSPSMVSYAKQAVRNADFLVMDMRSLAFTGNLFDGAWANAAYIHLPKREALPALREAHRVLKPQGRFFATFKQGGGEGMERDARFGGVEKYYAYYTPTEVSELVQSAGFTITSLNEVCYDRTHNTVSWTNVQGTKR